MTLTTPGTLIILTQFVGCDQRAEEAVDEAESLISAYKIGEAANLVAWDAEVKRINLMSRIVVIMLEFTIFISPD